MPAWNWPLGIVFIAIVAAITFVLLEWLVGGWQWGGV